MTSASPRVVALTAAALTLAVGVRAKAQSPHPAARPGAAAPRATPTATRPSTDSRIVAADVRTPRVSSKGGLWTLEVPRAMAAALAAWDTSFVPFGPKDYSEELRESLRGAPGHVPWATLNLDVNGDRRLDLVVMGHTRRQMGLAAVVSGPDGYRVTLLGAGPWAGRLEGPVTQYILVREGPEFTTCEGKTLRAAGALFGLQTPDKGGPVLHFLTPAGWRSVYAGC